MITKKIQAKNHQEFIELYEVLQGKIDARISADQFAELDDDIAENEEKLEEILKTQPPIEKKEAAAPRAETIFQ